MMLRLRGPIVLTANPCSRDGSLLIIVKLPDLRAWPQRFHKLSLTLLDTLPTKTPVSTSDRNLLK